MEEINKEAEEVLKEVADSFPIYEIRYIDNFTNEEWERRKKLMRESFVEAFYLTKILVKIASDVEPIVLKATAASIAAYSEAVKEPLTASELQTLFATGCELVIGMIKYLNVESEESVEA